MNASVRKTVEDLMENGKGEEVISVRLFIGRKWIDITEEDGQFRIMGEQAVVLSMHSSNLFTLETKR